MLDTSVFIAGEAGRSLAVDLLPDEAAVSVDRGHGRADAVPAYTQDGDFEDLAVDAVRV